MQHHIETAALGPQGEHMARAVAACVHCGFCLPACPTYRVLEEEMDSPRGRIFLMKGVLEGEMPIEDAVLHIDRCLGCLACVTACPSGVAYGELLTPFRAHVEPRRQRPIMEALRRRLALDTLPYPWRFRTAVRAGRLARPLSSLMPAALRPMLDLISPSLPPAQPLPALYPATAPRRARVAMLAGCVQQVLAPEIGWAAVRVLAFSGVEVVVPSTQSCCGALAMHVGEKDRARRCARQNIQAFPQDVDAIVTTAAGCGSGMQEYGLLLEGEPDEVSASAFAARVVDVSAFLQRLGVPELPPLPAPTRVVYQDACHLLHAQQVKTEPRALLRRIPNVSLVEIPGGTFCCGSAGTYNIDQPATAAELGARAASGIIATNADIVVSGNIGCLTQLRSHLTAQQSRMEVLHTIQLVDRAIATGIRPGRSG